LISIKPSSRGGRSEILASPAQARPSGGPAFGRAEERVTVPMGCGLIRLKAGGVERCLSGPVHWSQHVMTIGRILLVLDANAPAEPAATLAASLTTAEGGVEGVCLFHEPEPTVAGVFSHGGKAVTDVLDRVQSAIAAQTADAAAAFRTTIIDQGRSSGWRVAEIDGWRSAALPAALLSDLVVLAPAGADRAFQGVVAGLVLQSAAPCLIAPAEGVARAPFRHVAVAWNGSREAARAVRDAMFFLQAADRVTVLIAAEEATRWIDTSQVGALRQSLARRGVTADIVDVDAGSPAIGQRLLAQCRTLGVDLLVSGAYGHPRAAEALLGGVTRTLLSHAQLPVLLSH
jgi:nucleotide-binding universal stress UspA family protein